MALPKRLQPLSRFLAFHGYTQAQFGAALGCTSNEVSTLVKGMRYPTPRELKKISAIFNDLPVEVFFEEAMLKYADYEGEWPPKGKGFRRGRTE